MEQEMMDRERNAQIPDGWSWLKAQEALEGSD